jgi:hypothetical protein
MKKNTEDNSRFLHSRGLRWGRLLSAVDFAKQALRLAANMGDMCPTQQQKMSDVYSALDALEQALWLQESQIARPTKNNRKKKK